MSDMTFNTTSGSGFAFAYQANDPSISFRNTFLIGCLLSTGFAITHAENHNNNEIELSNSSGLHHFFENKMDPSRSLDTNLFISDKNAAKELSDELASFYQDLAAKQEPLGAEFEKVLYENIEELYI